MPVYVDPLFKTPTNPNWPYTQSCHLMADTDAELHTMAKRIGLIRLWHQASPPASVSHYDLTPNKRRAAIHAGALEVDRRFRPGDKPAYLESLFP